MGRIVAFSKWDELTPGTNCCSLELGTNCRWGRIVAWDELSPNRKFVVTEVCTKRESDYNQAKGKCNTCDLK